MVEIIDALTTGDVGADAPALSFACQGRNGYAEDKRCLRARALCRKIQDWMLHLGSIKLVEFLRHVFHDKIKHQRPCTFLPAIEFDTGGTARKKYLTEGVLIDPHNGSSATRVCDQRRELFWKQFCGIAIGVLLALIRIRVVSERGCGLTRAPYDP